MAEQGVLAIVHLSTVIGSACSMLSYGCSHCLGCVYLSDACILVGCMHAGCMHAGRVHEYWSDACIQVACIAWVGSDWTHWMFACSLLWGQWVCLAACLRQYAWAYIWSMFGACMPAHRHPPSHLYGYCTYACIDAYYCVALTLHLHRNSCLRLHWHCRPYRLLSHAALALHLRSPQCC